MSVYLAAFLVVAVVFLVSGILLLVRAFRVSIVWGLIALLVPFGRIVFVFMHWSEAGKLFLIQMVSLGLCFLLLLATPLRDELHIASAKKSAAPVAASAARPTPHEVRDLAENETPAVAADPNATPRAAYVRHAAELNALYQELNAERPKLKPGTPAVAAFNVKAARYQQGLQSLAAEKAQLDALDHPTPTPARPGATPASRH